MSKCIIAIGGGSIGRVKDNIKTPYETLNIDKEIALNTNKTNPNLLFIGHASELSESYFNVIKDNFTKLGCICRHLKHKTLKNMDVVQNMIDWADIIYVGGGNTNKLMDIWKTSGLDKILIKAYDEGKIMCGISSGGMCWFNCGLSDSMRIEAHDDNAPLIGINGLNIINSLFVPHAGMINKQDDSIKDYLKDKEYVGLVLTNGSAIEIKDNSYKVLNSIQNATITKRYWLNDKYYINNITSNGNLTDLLNKE